MTEMEQFGAQRLSVKNVENKPDIDFTCSLDFTTILNLFYAKTRSVRHNGHKSPNFGVE